MGEWKGTPGWRMSLRSSAEATSKQLPHPSPFMEITDEICNKKRKISHHDDDDDEQKMEKFFAIIRSIREVRHYFTAARAAGASSNGVVPESIINKAGDDGLPPAPADLHHVHPQKRPVHHEVWKPSFEREDFMGSELAAMMMVKNPPPPPPPPPAGSGTKLGPADHRKEGLSGDEEEMLDLKLSL